MSFSPYVLPGDPRREALDELQAKIEELISERRAIDRKPICASELRARIEGSIALSGSGLERVSENQRRQFPQLGIDASAPLSLGDLAWIFGRESIVERMCDALMPAGKSAEAGILSEARFTRISEIEAKMESLQTEEEREVLGLFDKGIRVLRRESADPRVIFHVWAPED